MAEAAVAEERMAEEAVPDERLQEVRRDLREPVRCRGVGHCRRPPSWPVWLSELSPQPGASLCLKSRSRGQKVACTDIYSLTFLRKS